jgi:hypothetical protein
MNFLLAQFAGHISGVEYQPPFARVRGLPTKRAFRHPLDEPAVLEFRKGTLGRSPRDVAGRDCF